MLSISHALTGAFLASKLPSPAIYLPLTLVSHYLEDWIPHWDVGTGLSNGHRRRLTAFGLEIVDLAITLSLVYWWWQAGQPIWQWHVWLGTLMGLLPDFLEAPRNFLKWEPGFLRPINNFHQNFHHSTPHKWVGLGPQLILIAAIWWLK